MSYESERSKFGKEKINVVEIDIDYCANTFGVAPCTATGSGDDKCYNCFESCQDVPNYVKTTKTHRYCTNRSPHPFGLADAPPSLLDVSITPSEIDVSGGLGVRASASLSFMDHPSSDLYEDPYVTERTYNPLERGTYWTKFRSRNPNYQNRPIRILTGYIVNNTFDSSNFITRHYIIDSLDVTNGTCKIKAKDPLKLASLDNALAPAVSGGLLNADINETATVITVDTDSGDLSEYPNNGKISIDSEVMTFIKDFPAPGQMTINRAQNNTVASSHSTGATVQLCLEYIGQGVHEIASDLLINYANLDPAYIDLAAWQAEVETFVSSLLSGIIAKPFDVNKLLKELGQAAPHYLWWDERTQQINLTALKEPPESSDVLDMDENFVADSLTSKDKVDMRKSTIVVNFGQIDPTKSIDEANNYEQSYARIDSDSVVKYGSSKIQTINSRWITRANSAAARRLAALIGRRFSDIPREIGFSLEDKDGSVWIGQTRDIESRDIVDFSGVPERTAFQLISAKEGALFDYKALEFTYGQKLDNDPDPDPDVNLIIINVDTLDLNIRTLHDTLYPPPTATTKVRVVIEGGVIMGASSISNDAIDTGTWPAGVNLELNLAQSSFIVGKGGNGGSSGNGQNGGNALALNYDLTLINAGIIGGGGGGGGGGTKKPGSFNSTAGSGGGGGGAGGNIGLGGAQDAGNCGSGSTNGSPGTTQTGGARGNPSTGCNLVSGNRGFFGGKGGDLGQSGNSSEDGKSGGSPGDAINQNGFTLNLSGTGQIIGAVNP